MDFRSATSKTSMLAFSVAAIMCATITSGAWAQYPGDHRGDSHTCASFGAPPGSREYSRCMLSQQQRRDYAPLNAAEAQRLSAEAARNNVETVHRMRCEREAKKDVANGVPSRRC